MLRDGVDLTVTTDLAARWVYFRDYNERLPLENNLHIYLANSRVTIRGGGEMNWIIANVANQLQPAPSSMVGPGWIRFG